jgi:hypothetical protein
VAFREGTSAAPGARGGPLPVVRDAGPGDAGAVLAVYSACIAADPGYLPFLAPGDEAAILGWFRLKPLVAFLVAEAGGAVAGVAGCGMPGPARGPGSRAAGGWRHAGWPCTRLTVAVPSPATWSAVGHAGPWPWGRTACGCAASRTRPRTGWHCRTAGPGGRLPSSRDLLPASGPSCWPARSANGRPGVRDRDRAPSGGARPACQARLKTKTATVPGRA